MNSMSETSIHAILLQFTPTSLRSGGFLSAFPIVLRYQHRNEGAETEEVRISEDKSWGVRAFRVRRGSLLSGRLAWE